MSFRLITLWRSVFNEATFQEMLLPSSSMLYNDGRSILQNVASLNILIHSVINLYLKRQTKIFLWLWDPLFSWDFGKCPSPLRKRRGVYTMVIILKMVPNLIQRGTWKLSFYKFKTLIWGTYQTLLLILSQFKQIN